MKVVTCQASGSRHRLPGRVAGSMVSLRMRSAWGSHSSSTSSAGRAQTASAKAQEPAK
ncbi:hypothetical protein D3C86_2151480 [compost metagenome]